MERPDRESEEPEPEAAPAPAPSLEVSDAALALGGRSPRDQRTMMLALQRSAGNAAVASLLRSVAPPAGPQAAANPTWLVGDEADSVAGQERLGDFLDRVHDRACEAAAEALAGTLWTAAGCPWVTHWVDQYRLKTPAETMAALTRYAGKPPATPEEALGLIAARVRTGITAWREDGTIPEPPPELAGAGGPALAGGAPLGLARSAAEAAGRGDALGASIALGEGQPLAGAARARMESAFGGDLSDVRIHDDAAGAAVAGRLQASAVAVGRHVAFAPGRYEPGTVAGDALMAHEIAHVLQQDGGGGELARSEAEADADQAAGGALAAIYGRSGARGRAALRSGLALNRCELFDQKETEVTGAEREQVIKELDLKINANRAPERGTTGLIVRFTTSSVPRKDGSIYTDYFAETWIVTPPGGKPEEHEALFGGNEVVMDKPGDWKVQAKISVPGGRWRYVYLEHIQHIDPVEEVAGDAMGLAGTPSWEGHQAAFEAQKMIAANRTSRDQDFGGAHIVLENGDNPAPPPKDQTRIMMYRAKPNPQRPKEASAPKRFRWLAVGEEKAPPLPKNFLPGIEPTTYHGKPAYKAGEGETTLVPFDAPGTWTIVCEMLDGKGQTVETAKYRQTILNVEQKEKIDKLEKAEAKAKGLYAKLDPQKAVALKAVHVEGGTAQATELAIFAGPPSGTWGGGFILLDLTLGAARAEYSGNTLAGAVDSFDQGNSYPEGTIVIEGPGVERRPLKTRGESTARQQASGLGWASLGFAIAGGIALFTPAAPLAPLLFAEAAVFGAASGAVSLADRLNQAEIDEVGVAIDVVGIAGSIVSFGQAGAWMKAAGKGVHAIRGSRFLIYTGLATDVIQGTLIAADAIPKIDQILNSTVTDDEKRVAIVKLLTMLIVQGGLIAFGAKDIKTARGRVTAAMGKEAEQVVRGLPPEVIHGLDGLPDNALAKLKGVTNPAELEKVGRLVGSNRDGAGLLASRYPDDFVKLAKTGRHKTLEELAEELGRKHPDVTPVPGAAKPKTDEPHDGPKGAKGKATEGDMTPHDSVLAEHKMTNEHGEPHEFHVTADGTIYRCSWNCEPLIEATRVRAARLRRALGTDLKERKRGAQITEDLHKLMKRAERLSKEVDELAQKAAAAKKAGDKERYQAARDKLASKSEDSLMRRAEEIERKMSKLELDMGLQPKPDLDPRPKASAADLRKNYPDLLKVSKEAEAELADIERAATNPANADDVARRLSALEQRLLTEAQEQVPDMVARARAMQAGLGNQTHSLSIGGRTYEKCVAHAGGAHTASGAQSIPGYSQRTREVADHAKAIGHSPAPDNFDEGVAGILNKGKPDNEKIPVEGAARLSHAEKQAAMAAPNDPIAVSLVMCFDCYAFFRKHARATGRPQVVADPEVVRIFMHDGRVLAPGHSGTAPLGHTGAKSKQPQ